MFVLLKTDIGKLGLATNEKYTYSIIVKYSYSY